MNFRLVSAILRHPWHIEKGFVEGQMTALAAFLEGKIEFTIPKDIKPFSLYGEHGSDIVGFTEIDPVSNKSSNGLIAVTNIIGPTMKYDANCGPIGTVQIGENLKELDRNPDVIAHVIRFDTPGGQADGTGDLAVIIKSLTKPTIGFITGYCCSAGMWMVSACDVVISTHLSLIGSIGTMSTFVDYQPMLEKEGVKFHDVYAPQSTDKNRIFSEVLDGKYENYQNDILKPLAQDFIDNMKVLRPLITDKHTSGNTWYARDMVGILVDKLGTFADAMAEAMTAGNNSNTNSNQNMITKSFVKLETKLGGPIALTDGGTFLNEEQLQTIEDSLTDGEAEPPVVVAPVATVAPVAVVAETITVEAMNALNSENAELRSQVTVLQTKLNAAPAVAPASAVVDTALFPSVPKDEVGADEVNSYVKNL